MADLPQANFPIEPVARKRKINRRILKNIEADPAKKVNGDVWQDGENLRGQVDGETGYLEFQADTE